MAYNRMMRLCAQRYVDLYGATWNSSVIERLEQCVAAIGTARSPLMLLRYDFVSSEMGLRAVQACIKRLDLEAELIPLVGILHTMGVLFLLGNVVQHVLQCYKKQYRVTRVIISTVHPLPKDYINRIVDWFTRETAYTVATVQVRAMPALMGGMRIESAECVGDYSVRAHLQSFARRCKWKDIIK